MMMLSSKPIAAGLTVAITLGAALAPGGTANAALLSSNALAVKDAVPNNVIDVHRRYYRGYGWGGGAAVAGLALGFMGAAIASRHYGYGPYYGYGPHYGYGPYYAGGYYSHGYYPYRPYRYRYRYHRHRYY